MQAFIERGEGQTNQEGLGLGLEAGADELGRKGQKG